MGENPTVEELRLHEFGQAVRKGSIPALNDFLSKMLTINSALIAATFAAVKSEVLHPKYCVAVAITFFISLVACLVGLYPRPGTIDFSSQNDLSWLENSTLKRKNIAMWVAGVAFVLAILIAIFDLVRTVS